MSSWDTHVSKSNVFAFIIAILTEKYIQVFSKLFTNL